MTNRTTNPVAGAPGEVASASQFDFGPIRPHEVAEIARLHYDFFGEGEAHGAALANLGPQFLEEIFYGLNMDNPHLFVDVARYQEKLVAFSVYSSNRKEVFRYVVRRHFFRLIALMTKFALRRPWLVASRVARNLTFMSERLPACVRDVPGFYLLLAVRPECRTRDFLKRTRVWPSDALWQRMLNNLRERRCGHMWCVVSQGNDAVNRFCVSHKMKLVAQGHEQSLPSNFYLLDLNSD